MSIQGILPYSYGINKMSSNPVNMGDLGSQCASNPCGGGIEAQV